MNGIVLTEEIKMKRHTPTSDYIIHKMSQIIWNILIKNPSLLWTFISLLFFFLFISIFYFVICL